jgi:general stress protein 26
MGESVYEIESVDDQWHSPDASWFRVRASDGNIYVLRHDCEDIWTIQSFRRRA